MAEQRDPRASGHDPFLEFQIGDAASLTPERGGDALHDCGPILADGFGQAGQGREAGGRELLEQSGSGAASRASSMAAN
ncbi:hypothetical protein [Streptomyces sp. TRM68367]|uniref:hypothetical protein n=1 Tax=Streptomyces sp. TRM68367 TaxID=2758415 RepID=UPI00165A3643|nr:hypothetical protein [Streptomyces sp. TRM68367]MBC9727521.1 hypothetical protein [Streptomyces sp. TRM68367]